MWKRDQRETNIQQQQQTLSALSQFSAYHLISALCVPEVSNLHQEAAAQRKQFSEHGLLIVKMHDCTFGREVNLAENEAKGTKAQYLLAIKNTVGFRRQIIQLSVFHPFHKYLTSPQDLRTLSKGNCTSLKASMQVFGFFFNYQH